MSAFKKLIKMTGALLLSAVMLVSSGSSAFGLSVSPAEAEKRQADLNYLYDNLKAIHPNIYANTPENDFLVRKAQIESKLNSESDAQFVLDLQSFVALIMDSHTQLSINIVTKETLYYPMSLLSFDGEWVLSAAEESNRRLLGMTVTAFNGLSMDEVLLRFSKFLSADNLEKLKRQFRQGCYVEELLRYAGIVEDNGPLTLTLKNSAGGTETLTLNALDLDALKKLDISSLSDMRVKASDTDATDSYYYAKALNPTAYYIQYNRCAEAPDLPMKDFCAKIKTALDAGSYSQIIVDLRYNGGGSDGVIYPLIMLLREEMDKKNTKVTALIGEATFSSAIINAVELQEMGCALVGEAASGSVNHFGSLKSFKLPNSGIPVQVSSKFISLSGFFDAAAGKGVVPLTPDISVPQTLSDYLAGRDTCVNWVLSNPEKLNPQSSPSAPLTRSRFVGMLYKEAGSPAQKLEKLPFSDLFGFEWFIPALNWAAKENIALGTGSDKFSGVNAITWQEAAVFLVRSASALGLSPSEVRSGTIPEQLINEAWDKASIEKAWKWGFIPEDANFSRSPTRAQGEAMARALSKIA